MNIAVWGWVTAVLAGTGVVFLLAAIWGLRNEERDDRGRWN